MSRLPHLSLAVAICCVSSVSARAETIHFEDDVAANDPAVVVGESDYEDLGVVLLTDDGATWGGIPDDNPGGWDLEGTDGPTFLGFDGESDSDREGYTLTARFAAPVVDFELDVAAGSSPYGYFGIDQFTLIGYLEGGLVDSVTVPLEDVNVWTTVALVGEVDEVFWIGAGLPGMRFGVDRLHWVGPEGSAPGPMQVLCDIKPGDDANVVKASSRGVVPVAVYGAEGFDVLEVDPGSIGFGPGGASLAHRDGPHVLDLDGDGYLDLLTHHRVRDADLEAGAGEACMAGMTFDGVEFFACEGVSVLPGR